MLFFTKRQKRKISEYLDQELPVDQTLDVSESLAFDPELNSLASDFANTDKLVKNVELLKTIRQKHYKNSNIFNIYRECYSKKNSKDCCRSSNYNSY